ncbi:MAG: FAD-binding oxidoreductase [Deltaproteobacteria bacterium]|nr:FAD-binding oxidoreductase [Deltaproteobacteria bacterium]MBW2295999.1 FAD-binding oxidoreductase [Deltaproteobacteria bacterium]
MNFNPLSTVHIQDLKAMVAADRFSTGASVLKLHAKDQSHHRGCLPEAVIWPTDRLEVVEILKYANDNRLPVVGWGSGSSLEGNPIPVKNGLVLDFSQMNCILDVREEDFQVDVQPGVIYQDLNEHLKYTGLFFPPDPGARATVGGMIANNASGTRTVYYGSTKDYVLKLTVVLASGEVLEMGRRVSKTSSGYDLPHLFVGSEGTLGVVVEATLRLVGLPEEFSAAVVTFPSVEAAGKAVSAIVRYGLNPAALELLDSACIELFNREKALGLDLSPTLFLEFHGPSIAYLSEIMGMAEEICRENGSLAFSPGLGRDERNRLFEARHELGEMVVRAHTDCRIQVLDVAVPITAYPDIISMARQEADAAGIQGYAFSHAGDGNLHLCLAGRKDEAGDWERIDRISQRMVSKAISLGGTATGEHGVGIGKRKYMLAEHGSSLEWMQRIKSLFDPNGILNPGKIFP